MELFETQKGRVLEQLKEALLTHTPIAFIPTNDLDFIKDLIFSEDTHGAIIPRIKFHSNKKVCLEHNHFFEIAPATGSETYISDNYFIYPSSFNVDNIKVPSLIVLSIENWNDTKILRTFIRRFLGIKNEKTYLDSETIDKFHRSLCIVTAPTNLPVPTEYTPYVKKIEIPPLDDKEIEEIILQQLSRHKYDGSILTSDFTKQLIICLRGFSTTKIRHMFAEMYAKQYFSKKRINEKGILSIIRAEKKALMDGTPGLKWENIGDAKAAGLSSLEEWIKDRIDIFADPEKAKSRNIDIPNGLLVSGIPGSGKSLMAKTTASLLDLPLISLDMGSLLGGIMGQSEHNMIEALHMAEQMAPCVLWIDEIEKAFSGSSQNSSSGDSGVGRRMFGKFLTWMQEKSSACFVFATSNDITALPPELFRSERFDRKFFTFMPNVHECASIFASIIRKENALYKKNIGEMPSAQTILQPQLLFAVETEKPQFWVSVLNQGCAPMNLDLTLQLNLNEDDKCKVNKRMWKDSLKPHFKLLTGADISALVKEIKFELSKGGKFSQGLVQSVYSETLVKTTALSIISSTSFKPYGETNVLDIVKCFYRLYINQFVPASGKCILDFDKYIEEDDYYQDEDAPLSNERYDKALYYLLVGAINYYGPKIRAKI